MQQSHSETGDSKWVSPPGPNRKQTGNRPEGPGPHNTSTRYYLLPTISCLFPKVIIWFVHILLRYNMILFLQVIILLPSCSHILPYWPEYEAIPIFQQLFSEKYFLNITYIIVKLHIHTLSCQALGSSQK